MKLPKYNSKKTAVQLLKELTTYPITLTNGDNLYGYEHQIVTFALEYLSLNFRDDMYESFYDYIKYHGPHSLKRGGNE